MTRHTCPRCGFESQRDTWVDRHRFTTVAIIATVGGVLLTYPWFFLPVLLPVLVVVCAVLVNRAARRRAAIAARADWDYRLQMAHYQQRPAPDAEQMRRTAWQPDPWPPASPPPVRPSNPAPWHVVTQWPTRRFQKGKP